MVLSVTGAMRLYVVVIIPETSFTRAHSILTDNSTTIWVIWQSRMTPPRDVCPHLAVVFQVQAVLREGGVRSDHVFLHCEAFLVDHEHASHVGMPARSRLNYVRLP
jgi:hypothetical protein